MPYIAVPNRGRLCANVQLACHQSRSLQTMRCEGHCRSVPCRRYCGVRSLSLSNIQTLDLAGRRQLKSKIGSKITPFFRMKSTDQVQPLVLDEIDRSKSLVAEHFLGELLQISRPAIVAELRVRFKECGPCLPVPPLQGVNRSFDCRISQSVRYHVIPLCQNAGTERLAPEDPRTLAESASRTENIRQHAGY